MPILDGVIAALFLGVLFAVAGYFIFSDGGM